MASCFSGPMDKINERSHLRRKTKGHKGFTPLALGHAVKVAELAPKRKPASPAGMLSTEAAKGPGDSYWAVVDKMPAKPGLTQGNRINWRGCHIKTQG